MKVKHVIFEYLQIVLGCFIGAIGLTVFLVPNKVASGGISGIATVFYHIFGFPIGWTMLILNIPLFLLGVVFLGKNFGAKTLLGAALFAVFAEITRIFPVVTDDILLATVYGSLIFGLGLGIVFRARGSTGGTDLVAMLIHHFFPIISIGQGIMLTDFLVIISAGILFNWELAMYSWIGLFITSKVIDIVQEGFNYSKAVYIISDESETISRKILEHMGRGVTLFEGKGAYTKDPKNILLCVTTRIEMSKLKNIIISIDPKAFVVVHNVHEVLGEGFSFSIT